MKKVLILTTSTGQGHNQAASSLIDAFSKEGFECIKLDFLASNSKILNKTVVKGYEILASKFPSIYGWFYDFTDSEKTNTLLQIVFTFTTKKLLKSINLIKPDLIIGTHPLTVNLLAKLKKKNKISIPFISIVTDFKAHFTYVNKLVDLYITGSEYTKKSLIDRGISYDKIVTLGIPIKSDFYTNDKKVIEIKDKEYFNLLLMSGSMGLNNIYFVLNELLNNKHKLRITVVCGNNKALKEQIINKCSQKYPNKKIHILGFTNDVSMLMDYSDAIISKPGGLTATESIVKNLPLIIPFSIPGQEMENTKFLCENGYAICINNVKDINSTLDFLIENPNKLKEMKKNMNNLSSTYSTKKIVSISSNLINV
ncbi:MAG: glycosyltransferase [Clostridiales bacterium]|nr:glycosyltransferase [Clostridiales bacterium]